MPAEAGGEGGLFCRKWRRPALWMIRSAIWIGLRRDGDDSLQMAVFL